MNKGWIQLHRVIMDFWVWEADEKYDKAHAFIDLLLMANHKDNTISINGNPVPIKRGQFHTSQDKLAKKWNWDRKTVKKFLINLKKTNTIDFAGNYDGTTITIVNYDVYQGFRDNQLDNSIVNTTNNSFPNLKDSTTVTCPDDITVTNNNDNNENTDNNDKKYNSDFERVWVLYPRKSDKNKAYSSYCSWRSTYSEKELLEACKNYSDDCKEAKTSKQYIKKLKNFYGMDGFFKDYLSSNGYIPSKKNTRENSFQNFNERDYDFEALENETLGN